ncbi:hypothetical protein SOM08_06105 [Hydrogenophaga sp. SNF1]|uniref:hypothetical protein n=1 Tax=Hydrogenophaga sp. SNF1 TaxID=3098762 RepID=UPI002ACC0510|nr:hypothetical protein [Hydrogenophaga sp. SNF1]WQB84884.1 hypothetical protein SOM08_06105 [Hydrogenophaga sp. SNF1]
MKKLNINAIRIDGGTQSRVEIDMEVVGDYAEAVKVGIDFPPIVVFNDGADQWLADGFHRYHAHKQAGKASIGAEVREGTVRDAILYSLGANGAHGLRRSNADKRKSVLTLLADPEWSQWSDRKIAEACGVTHPFVASLRKPPEVVTVTTPRAEKRSPVAVSGPSSPKGKPPEPGSKKDAQLQALKAVQERDKAQEQAAEVIDKLSETQEAVRILSEENDRLNDRLAVEAMDASEEEKTAAADTIAQLREQVRVLQIELDAVKASRDTYMRESAQKEQQIKHWRKQAEKAGAVTA